MKTRKETKNYLLFSLSQWLEISWNKDKQTKKQQFLSEKQELAFTTFGGCLTKLLHLLDLHMIQKSVHIPSKTFTVQLPTSTKAFMSDNPATKVTYCVYSKSGICEKYQNPWELSYIGTLKCVWLKVTIRSTKLTYKLLSLVVHQPDAQSWYWIIRREKSHFPPY